VTWWIKARLVHTVLAGGLVAFMALTLALQDASVVLPSFTVTAGNSVVLAFFTPLLVVGTLAQCLDSRLASAELTGTRPVPWMDTALIAAAMATVLAFTSVAGAALGSGAVLQAGRNTVFLTGLLLIARAFAGRAGIMLPLVWIFAVVFFGRLTGTHYRSWAVTALPAHTVHAAVAAVLGIVIGTGLNQLASRKTL
jgi:hypothetical protein